jgi:hypothetical protein
MPWIGTGPTEFPALSGIKLWGLMLPFCSELDFDDLLCLLGNSRVGCYFDIFLSALAYARDLTLCAPTL